MHIPSRTLSRIAPALACAALVLAQEPEAETAPSRPIATLPMTTPLGLPFVWATVRGGEPRWLCFDTGATQTFLDRTFVEGLGFAVQDLGTAVQPGGAVRFGKTSGVTQGVLFPELMKPAETPTQTVDETDDGDDADSEDDSPRPRRGNGKKRTPGKVDTAGLPCEDRVHDVPEEQRFDSITGKPLVVVGEKVFREIDYIRAQLVVVRTAN